jgi:RNA polymerase sigma factor (sigma-70 family)
VLVTVEVTDLDTAPAPENRIGWSVTQHSTFLARIDGAYHPRTPHRDGGPDGTAGDDPAPSDETSVLVRGAVGGDRAALDDLVLKFMPLLQAQARHRLGRSMIRHIDVDDVVAETWLVLLRRAEDLRPRNGRMTPVLLAFLSATLLNVANKKLREHGIRRTREVGARRSDSSGGPALDQHVADITGAVSRAARAEEAAIVLEAIERLSETDREIVVLRGIECLTNGEVAAELGIAPNAVSQRYRRALAHLRAQLPESVFAELADA